MIRYIVEYEGGIEKVYRKLWWGGKKYIGEAKEGGIIAAGHVVRRDMLDNFVRYDFVNKNPGQEDKSKRNCRF